MRKNYLKDKGLFVGWGIKMKPFTRKQYKKSWINKNYEMNYKGYLREAKRDLRSRNLKILAAYR